VHATLGDVLAPDGLLAGVLAAIAAVIQGWRLTQWGALKTLRQPIVWVLHVAYLWLPVGLALKAVALLNGAPFSAFWLHALLIGTLAGRHSSGQPLSSLFVVVYAPILCRLRVDGKPV
jgi:uncharacterized protein involved in response to NO